MKLIDLLVKELPKRGGWPNHVKYVVQDYDTQIKFVEGSVPPPRRGSLVWMTFGTPVSITIDNCFELADDFDTKIVTRKEYEAALNKSYLPQVGEECDFKKQVPSPEIQVWRRGVVRYISENTVVMKAHEIAGETVGHPDTFEFRPIDKEREKAIDEIGGILFEMRCSSQLVEIAERIYDAGYRKQK